VGGRQGRLPRPAPNLQGQFYGFNLVLYLKLSKMILTLDRIVHGLWVRAGNYQQCMVKLWCLCVGMIVPFLELTPLSPLQGQRLTQEIT
jgi:hypothetical protein